MSWSKLGTPIAVIGLMGLCFLLGFLAHRHDLLSFARDTATAPVSGDRPPSVDPPGYWARVDDDPTTGTLTDDEREQLLALPYVAGTVPAGARTGVTVHDGSAAFDGVNLYVSGHGFEATLMTMDGEVLHRWELPLAEVFPGASPVRENLFWRRARLLEGGDLLAIYEHSGVARVDVDSKLIWAHRGRNHHDLDLDDSGNVYVLGGRDRPNRWLSGPREIADDVITILGADGELVDELSVYDCFDHSDYAAVLTFMGGDADVFHTNTLTVLDGSQEHHSPHFRKGNLLISVRNLNTVAIIDPAASKVVWALAGMWIRQHEPVLLANGRMLVFDNNVGYERSRVLEFDPFTQELFWRYDGSEARPLNTLVGGVAQRLPNGNTLIVESDRGRALEVDRDGKIVWEFHSPHRVGERGKLVAVLFDLVRLDEEQARFARR